MPLYNSALGTGIDWTADTMRVALFRNGFVEDVTDENLSDIVGTEVSGYTRPALTSKTRSNAIRSILDAADTTITGVTSTDLTHAVVFKDTGNASTSRLFAFFRLDGPRSITGGTITLVWSQSGVAEVRYL